MKLNALLTKTVKMSGVVVIAIHRQAARVNVHHTVNTHPGSVLRRVLSRDVMLAAMTKVVKVSFTILMLRIVSLAVADSDKESFNFRIAFNLTMNAYLLLIALNVLTKLTPTCQTVTVGPVRTVESRWRVHTPGGDRGRRWGGGRGWGWGRGISRGRVIDASNDQCCESVYVPISRVGARDYYVQGHGDENNQPSGGGHDCKGDETA